ncbi:hypothetical protein ACWGR4_29125 [Embleya sp. NPDC055664]
MELWGPDHRVTLSYGTGPWRAWCHLADLGPPPHPDSGAITLHDPRAGCDTTSLPGLPWGRPLTLHAAPGHALIAPGWVGASVLPVDRAHHLAVLTVETTSRG